MRRTSWMGLVLAATTACGGGYTAPTTSAPQATVVTASGDIAARVQEFRASLGLSNGGSGGWKGGGRREITWDGAAANPFDNRNDFPADFFNTTVRAGAVFTTSGTGFRNDSTRFAEVNATYATEFNFLSPTKLFSPMGDNVFDQEFRVAGQPTPAIVHAFGIVFSDVDVANRTTIELFARDGSSLGTVAAPVRSDAAGLSFVGVSYEEDIIARVRITLGTGALGVSTTDVSAGGSADLVVVDDVIYGEPRAAF